MPSLDHDALILLFHNQPALAAQLLRDSLHVALPEYTEIRLASSDLTEVVPAEFRADAVILCARSEPVLGVIVEAQLSRDERKRFTWPAYVAVLRARYECPVELLVVAPDRAVAAWAATPIVLDLGATVLRPRVLGPDGIPIVTDHALAAQAPELAVLSVCAHGEGDTETAASIARAAVTAIEGVPDDLRVIYSYIIENALSAAARKAFEMHPDMSKFIKESNWMRPYYEKGVAEGRAEGELRGRAEGELRGKAKAVLDVLSGRGIAVTDSEREQILAATDAELVSTWIQKALTVTSVAELLA
ncbi:MAG TPA: hypothetical protein VGI10_31330 [Polyangiaceae bacterium]